MNHPLHNDSRFRKPLIYVVDDEDMVRDTLALSLTLAGFRVACFASPAVLLEQDLSAGSCLVADVRMPEMDGLELHREIVSRGIGIPVILITGVGDVPLAVRAMRAGASDFIQKPFDDATLLASIRAAIEARIGANESMSDQASAQAKLDLLTGRELAVFRQLVHGRTNKIAALELGISPRTVEVHRAHIVRKLKANSLADLVRIALAAPSLTVPDRSMAARPEAHEAAPEDTASEKDTRS